MSFKTRKSIFHDLKLFFDNIKFETKGLVLNSYGKLRLFLCERIQREKKPDIIEYKGEPEPKTREKIISSLVTKKSTITNKMPRSFSEAKEIFGSKFRATKRNLRRNFLNFRESCVSGFSFAKEYVSQIRVSTVAGIGSVAVGGLAITFILTTILNSYAMGVTVNGEKVGFVENEEQFAALVNDVEKDISEENYNAEIQINKDIIELDSMAENKKQVQMLDEGKLKETILNTNAVSATAAAITVDGNPVLYVGTKDDANGILESIKNKYEVAGQDVYSTFRQDVQITEAAVDMTNLMPTPNAINYLLTGNETIKQYKVKKNDTDWDIARANGLTEKDIQTANPHMNTKVIKKGDVINISKMQPFVHTEVIATVNVTEKTKYKTKKVKTDNLYVGERKVKREGKRGQVSVTKRAVYINGKEESAQIISKNVIEKPQKRIVLIGTKEKPAAPVNTPQPSYSSSDTGSSSSNSNSNSSSNTSPVYKNSDSSYVSGSGTLSNPMRNMQLSSPFGNRNGRLHSGADFRNPAGTPIYAAAGGKVTYSGYDGAYGYTVRISHGNGMSTVYAHCKNLTVKSGTTVSKGQQVGTVGRTGRATGNHLHFEVRINGSPKNPLNYL